MMMRLYCRRADPGPDIDEVYPMPSTVPLPGEVISINEYSAAFRVVSRRWELTERGQLIAHIELFEAGR